MQYSSITYKIVSTTGQLAIKVVEDILSIFIREKGTVLDPSLFPWTKDIELNTEAVLKELQNILIDYQSIPNFDDLSPEQHRIITGQKKWKTFMLYTYGGRFEHNIKTCPETDRLLKKIPGMTSAFFSILEPHTAISPHRGPYKGVLRYHLGLIIPHPSDSCGIKVGDTTYHWQKGKSLIFDDTITHEAWNNSNEIRVVLFVDFKRSYPFPISLFNDIMISLIRRSPFIANIIEKVEKGIK